MEQGHAPVVLKRMGVDSITLIGGQIRRVVLASASRKLIAGENCTFEGGDPAGVWHVHIVFAGETNPRPPVDYARQFIVILPTELAAARCEDDDATAVLYRTQS